MATDPCHPLETIPAQHLAMLPPPDPPRTPGLLLPSDLTDSNCFAPWVASLQYARHSTRCARLASILPKKRPKGCRRHFCRYSIAKPYCSSPESESNKSKRSADYLKPRKKSKVTHGTYHRTHISYIYNIYTYIVPYTYTQIPTCNIL